MSNETDLRDAYAHLQQALILLDKLGLHLAAAEVDRASQRLKPLLTKVSQVETE